MRLWLLALFPAASLLASGCFVEATPCSGIADSALFVGRVLRETSDEGRGTGRARVEIEERLFNTSKELREVEIDTSALIRCYQRIEVGERYVVSAMRSDQRGVHYISNGYPYTFKLRGKEHILDALRNKAQNGPSRIVGTVYRRTGAYSREAGIEGAVVNAISGDRTFTVVSGAGGNYEILGVLPGVYHFTVSKTGLVPDVDYNKQHFGPPIINWGTTPIEPGSILVGDRSCATRDLSLLPDGGISGRVFNAAGAPLSGIDVQAFAFSADAGKEPEALGTAQTDAEGRYRIGALPAGDYIVGVNAELYRDTGPYPPAVSTKLSLSEGEEISGINLIRQSSPASQDGKT